MLSPAPDLGKTLFLTIETARTGDVSPVRPLSQKFCFFPALGCQTRIIPAIVRLPEKYKAPIHLHYYEGYSVAEIAEILGIGQSAVKMRMKRGREMLKLEMEDGE